MMEPQPVVAAATAVPVVTAEQTNTPPARFRVGKASRGYVFSVRLAPTAPTQAGSFFQVAKKWILQKHATF